MTVEVHWLLALPAVLLPYLWWLHRRSYAHLQPWARRASLITRTAVITLLILALARPSVSRTPARQHLVLVLDVSRSISADNLDAALSGMQRLVGSALDSSTPYVFSLIAFGEQAELLVDRAAQWSSAVDDTLRDRVSYQRSLPKLYQQRTALISGSTADSVELQELERRISDIEAFRDRVAREHTDVEGAIRLALNCGVPEEARSIYVFTDANFNRGEWHGAWDAARQAGFGLHTIALDRPRPPEVALSGVRLPAHVRIHQTFSAVVRIASTVSTKAQLEVYKDGFSVKTQSVQLQRGENLFTIPGLYFRDKGFHRVAATIRPEADTQLQNNVARALIVVPGAARVLYIDSDEEQIPYLKSALEIEGIDVDARPTTGVPRDLTDLLSFDALVLSNVPADRLSARQMQMIRSYVHDFGGGFVMLGGDQSFGLGGYYATPIEEILPIRMPIQKDVTRPTLGLMLVIDKSGSMAGAKIQLAKRAAIATAEAINPRDLIGVVGFDGQSRVILDLTPAANRGTITGHIGALDAGGGTFLFPALEDAHQRLVESNARRKHIIVLSDGQTQGFGYEDKIQAMSADGITVSTVGIGEGADMQLLDLIATTGGGRAYFTNDFYSIPQIFTKEALRASRSMLIERLVQPIAVNHDIALEEIDTDEIPPLTGYVATTPRSAANTILVSDSGDPLLAKWRFGLGRTVAFTSETKPRWAEDWIEWPDFAKFWSQLVRSVTGDAVGRDLTLECSHTRVQDGVRLLADVRDSLDNFVTDVNATLTAVDDDGGRTDLSVDRIGPGLFSAVVPNVNYGTAQQFAWHLAIDGQDRAETTNTPYGFIYPYSPEFQSLDVSNDTLDAIRSMQTGQTSSVGSAKLTSATAVGQIWTPLWPLLLAAALLLVPLDITWRRLG